MNSSKGRSGPKRPIMQQNLRRARKAMKKMVKISDEINQEEGGGDGRKFRRERGALPRKLRRKEARRLKKAKKHAFLTGKKLDEVTAGSGKRKDKVTSKKSKSEVKQNQGEETSASEKKKRKEEKFKKIQEEQRKQQLMAANEEEDKNIRRLEKDLRFRKKKRTKEKIVPTAFKDDGLDYLLDIVDPNMLEDGDDLDDELMELGRKLKSSHDDDDDDDNDDDDDDDGDDDEGSAMEEQDAGDDMIEHDEDADSDDDDDNDDDDDEEEKEDIDAATRKRKKGESKEQPKKKSRTSASSHQLDSDNEDKFEDGTKSVKKRKERTTLEKKVAKTRLDGNSDDDSEDDDVNSDIGDMDDDEDDDEELDQDESDENAEDDDDENEDGDGEDDADELPSKKEAPKMDPYGNIIGEKPAEKTGAYVPPHRRAELMGANMDADRKARLDRLRKQLKGAINRLSESNAQSICNQIEELYLSNSRNDMNETLCSLVQEACIGPALTPERLAIEHILMVAVLHSNVGSEVGAHLLQSLASRFDTIHVEDGNYGNGKEIDNILMLFVHLFNFRVIHCGLIYDMIRRLAEHFTERDIEMLLLVLRSAGTTLRKDDPSSLKDIILLIQGKANQCPEELKQQSRVKFMLETISALRNNNLRKIPNYDPALLDRLRKLHRSFIKERGHNDADSTLRISLADLVTAEQRGRWWIVGSAWSGHGPERDTSEQPSNQPLLSSSDLNDSTSQKIVELSRQQRMSTDLRRTIFSLIMTAEDFTDAFEKLVRLGLKGGRDREIVNVALDCCQQEKFFNPYYAHLAAKLCQFDRKFRMAFQFALWDKLRLLEELTPANSTNLALLLAHLIAAKALPLSVLKIVEFADINKHTVRFLQTLLEDLLLDRPDNTVIAVFGGVAMVTKLRILREGLGLFMHHFLMKAIRRKMKKMEGEGKGGGGENLEERLKKKVSLAESAMNGGDGMVKL